MRQDLDVTRWAKTDLWSIVEAPSILLGQDPDGAPDSFTKKDREVILEMMLKAVMIGSLRPIRNIDRLPAFLPIEVMAWAKTKEIPIPRNLEHAVQTAALAVLNSLPLARTLPPPITVIEKVQALPNKQQKFSREPRR